MPRLKKDAISLADIDQFCAGYSDFAFELKVASKAEQNGLQVTHGGTYNDPITSITREYDLRGHRYSETSKFRSQALLAIECKNLRANFPLLVHCVKRDSRRSYQNAVFTPSVMTQSQPATFSRNQQIVLRERNGLYLTGEQVGLSVDQVGKAEHNNCFVNNDERSYSRILQAVNSSYDLISDAMVANKRFDVVSLIFPVLVIPDDMLFVIDYDSSFKPNPSRSAEWVSLYTGSIWNVQGHGYYMDFQISHIDIVTIGKLGFYLNQIFHVTSLLEQKIDTIKNAYNSGSHELLC